MKRLSLIAAAALTGLLTGGCTVGPNYRKPNAPVPPNFRNATPEQQQPDASLADLPWWQIFKDPVLENLIRTALERNYEVRIAAEQIIAARALVGIVRADQLPQVSAGPGYSGGKTSINPTNTNALGVIADISYQLDLFGGLRRATESARASLLATEEGRRTVLVTLVSDVGTNYFQLLALDLQLGIARETVVRQEESVALTKSRADAGVATDVDWLQARQVLDAANSRIPELERQIRRTEDALSILLGNYPEDVPRGAVLTAQQLPPELPVGLTSALLDRRPDIRQAEKNLIRFNAEIGVARAQFFPQIALTGSGGRSAVFTSLMNSSTNIWSYGASLFQPVFQGGRLTSNLRYAESRQRQSLLIYSQTIQRAFGDVSDALVDVEKYREARVQQEQYVRNLDATVRLANLRYDGGITTFLEVLDAQRSPLRPATRSRAIAGAGVPVGSAVVSSLGRRLAAMSEKLRGFGSCTTDGQVTGGSATATEGGREWQV